MKFFIPLILLLTISCARSSKVVIAHRGASAYLPEHTLEAVALAHGFNVDYIEPDVVLTKDGIPIVLHDIVLDEVTDVATKFPDKKRKDGHYYAIDLTLNEIRQLNVTERVKKDTPKYPDRFPPLTGTFRIPTFKDYISVVQGLNKSRNKSIGLYPEIKNPGFHRKHGKDISKVVLATITEHIKKETPLILQCFDFEEVKRIRTELGYKGNLVQLIADNSWNESPTDYDKLMSDKGMEEVAMYADGLGMWISHLLKDRENRMVRKAHSLGMAVHGYTFRKDSLPADFEDSRELLKTVFDEMKLDGLFADHPDIALEYLKR